MKKSTAIILWGVITGVVSIIFSQILYATGQDNSGLKWFSMLILFLGIFIGTMQYRNKANEGYLTFGQGFKAGFLMAIIITVLTTIAMLVDLQIHPEMIDKILELKQTDMVNQGLPQDQIDMRMHYVRLFTTPIVMSILFIFFELLFGAILSLITAGLCTRNKPIFDNTNETPGTDTPQA